MQTQEVDGTLSDRAPRSGAAPDDSNSRPRDSGQAVETESSALPSRPKVLPPPERRRERPSWWRRALGPALVGLGVFALDQVTKAWILNWLADEQQGASWLGGNFSIIHVNNNGAAFGLLAGQMMLFVLIAVVVVAVLVAYYRFLPRERFWLRVSLGLQLGGALGNLLDRLRHGYVVDFMEVRDLPVFNVADASIVCGVAILAYYLIVRMDRPDPSAAANTTAPDPSSGPSGDGGGGAPGLPPATR